jgi:hypothetical protein
MPVNVMIEKTAFSRNVSDSKLLLRPTSMKLRLTSATHDDTTGREVVSGAGEMNLVHTPVMSKRLSLTRVRTSFETDVW